VALPFVGFAWQDQLASFGDDSASYLAVAHWFSPSGDPLVSAWAGYHANFPPLFPLLLALTGGIHDYRIATFLVGMFGAVGVALFYRLAALDLGERGGLVVALLFLLTTTAWITLKGVLSETLFFAALMGALLYREKGVRPLFFGLLMACAALSRAIGILLVVAYVIQELVRCVQARRFEPRALLPLAPVVVLVGLWYAIRPRAPVDMYGMAVGWVIDWWLANPGEMLNGARILFFDGWVRSFMASSEVTFAAKAVFAIVGLLGLVEAILRAIRNRLDGWFVVVSLVVIFAWTFSPETTRRLLYPLIPLMILFAASFVRSMLARTRLEGRQRGLAITAAIALPVLLTLPALGIVAGKSLDNRTVVAGCPQQFRQVTPYYSTHNQEEAEKLAVLEVSTLCGLQSLAKVTPPEATIMWSRPEYVAVLGHRRAVPLFYRWNARDMAEAVRDGKVDYVVVSFIFKNDIEGGRARPLSDMKLEEYTRPAFSLSDGIFTLRKVEK
jgi:hypothetical protein